MATPVRHRKGRLHQEADLTAGHGVLRTTGLVCVTVPTLDELDAAVASIEQAAI